MRVAVVSCQRYRDAWGPFFDLFKRFWPDCPYQVTLVHDHIPYCWPPELPIRADFYRSGETAWAQVLADFADSESVRAENAVMVFQEDFFLNAPVNQPLIDHALKLMERDNVGAVRLYPCPGANEEIGDPYFGRVTRHTAYRTSCQATIWKPGYLHAIASRFNTPSEFELQGSAWASSHLPAEVLAFKRDVQPWPIEYLCSAIGRGLWSQDAKKLCDTHGIEVDWSFRGFQPA